MAPLSAPRPPGAAPAPEPAPPSPIPAGARDPRAPDPAIDDPLTDFAAHPFPHAGVTYPVYTAGAGPAVILLAELPGISPQVARLARWIRDAGFAVYLPALFGVDGAYPQAAAGLAEARRICVRAELGALAAGAAAPITAWLTALARAAHAARGGPGVGAIGMCLTGNFAIAMMIEPAVRASVACQPSTPLGAPDAIQLAPDEARAIRARLEREDLTVRAYRFAGDRHCTAARFAAYAEALGPRFVARVLPDDAAHPAPPPFFAQVVGGPHSVLTAHLIDAAGEPTRAARDEILAFLAHRLRPEPTP